MTTPPTTAALLSEGVRCLRASRAGAQATASAQLDARLLLANALGVSRTHLLSHPESLGEPVRVALYRRLIGRRAAGEPVAYLTGVREFWSLALTVTPAVLIPRTETELLVERALAVRPDGTGRAADLGTGSGAVALALASERPLWRVVASDISVAALAVARLNARNLGLGRIELRAGDWFGALRGERFDLLLSNPPYVAADDPAMAAGALAFEPRIALTPGADALTCLRTLARGAGAHLEPGGWLLLEHGATQGAAVRHELVLAGFAHVRSQRDLAGHERVTEGQR